MKNISIKSVFAEAQDVFMKAPWHWIAVALVQFLILLCAMPLIAFFSAALTSAFYPSMPFFFDNVFPFIASTIYLMIVWSMMLNFYRMAQAALAGTNPEIKDIFRNDSRHTPFLLTTFTVAVITFIGSKVFVIPGLIASVVLFFSDVSSVEEHTGPTDSLYRSYELVRKDPWAVIVFMLSSAVFALIAIIPFGFGLLVFVPFIALSKIVFFRHIRSFEPMVVEQK